MPLPRPLPLIFGILALAIGPSLAADKEDADRRMPLADGQLEISAPKGWQRKQPRSNIVEHEFAIPAAKGDAQDGRLTVMAAGGSIDANIERWIGQFTQPKAGEPKPKPEVEKQKIAGLEVHFVDIAGTYKDSPGGPFAGGKSIERPDYRMLAAIIVAPKIGNYFIKLYGPEKTIQDQEKGFREMIEGLKRESTDK